MIDFGSCVPDNLSRWYSGQQQVASILILSATSCVSIQPSATVACSIPIFLNYIISDSTLLQLSFHFQKRFWHQYIGSGSFLNVFPHSNLRKTLRGVNRREANKASKTLAEQLNMNQSIWFICVQNHSFNCCETCRSKANMITTLVSLRWIWRVSWMLIRTEALLHVLGFL